MMIKNIYWTSYNNSDYINVYGSNDVLLKIIFILILIVI